MAMSAGFERRTKEFCPATTPSMARLWRQFHRSSSSRSTASQFQPARSNSLPQLPQSGEFGVFVLSFMWRVDRGTRWPACKPTERLLYVAQPLSGLTSPSLLAANLQRNLEAKSWQFSVGPARECSGHWRPVRKSPAPERLRDSSAVRSDEVPGLLGQFLSCRTAPD